MKTLQKREISDCLSSYLVRRWCYFEWFYSAIDYPWFAKREYVEYLNDVKLGNLSRLTQTEWGVIRSSLGKPRRFSKSFLSEERKQLEKYHEYIRLACANLRAGIIKEYQVDMAQSLAVGERVSVFCPKKGEIHDGIVRKISWNMYGVQFDIPEQGFKFVKDIYCMRAYQSENMPEAHKREYVAVDKVCGESNVRRRLECGRLHKICRSEPG